MGDVEVIASLYDEDEGASAESELRCCCLCSGTMMAAAAAGQVESSLERACSIYSLLLLPHH